MSVVISWAKQWSRPSVTIWLVFQNPVTNYVTVQLKSHQGIYLDVLAPIGISEIAQHPLSFKRLVELLHFIFLTSWFIEITVLIVVVSVVSRQHYLLCSAYFPSAIGFCDKGDEVKQQAKKFGLISKFVNFFTG